MIFTVSPAERVRTTPSSVVTEVFTISLVPSAFTRTATVPAATFSTGISTFTEVSAGRSSVTAGALSKSAAALTLGMGRDTVPV